MSALFHSVTPEQNTIHCSHSAELYPCACQGENSSFVSVHTADKTRDSD